MAEPTASFKGIEHTATVGVEIIVSSFPALVAASGEALFGLIVETMDAELSGRRACFRPVGSYQRIRFSDQYLPVDLQLAANRLQLSHATGIFFA